MRNLFICSVITLLLPVAATAGADTSSQTEEQRDSIDVESGLLRAFDVPQASGPSAFRVFYDCRDIGKILFPHMWMRIFGDKTPPHVFIVGEVTVKDSIPTGFFGEQQPMAARRRGPAGNSRYGVNYHMISKYFCS